LLSFNGVREIDFSVSGVPLLNLFAIDFILSSANRYNYGYQGKNQNNYNNNYSNHATWNGWETVDFWPGMNNYYSNNSNHLSSTDPNNIPCPSTTTNSIINYDNSNIPSAPNQTPDLSFRYHDFTWTYSDTNDNNVNNYPIQTTVTPEIDFLTMLVQNQQGSTTESTQQSATIGTMDNGIAKDFLTQLASGMCNYSENNGCTISAIIDYQCP